MEANEIKNRVTMPEVMNYFGDTVRKHGNSSCPFHEDRTPSMLVDDQHCYCFTCSESWDIFNYVGKKIGSEEFKVQRKFIIDALLGGEVPQSYVQIPRVQTRPKKKTVINPTENDLKIYSDFFEMLSLSEEHGRYLTEDRGISDDIIGEFQIKGIENYIEIYAKLNQKYSKEMLIHTGLLVPPREEEEGEDQTMPRFMFDKGAIIFPIFDESGRVAHFSSRNLEGPKTYKLARVSQKMLIKSVESDDEIYVFEGILDALSYYQLCGKRKGVAAAVGLLKAEDYIALTKQFPDKKVVITMDNDDAGRNATDRIKEGCPEDMEIYTFNWNAFLEYLGADNCKDMNDVLLDQFKKQHGEE